MTRANAWNPADSGAALEAGTGPGIGPDPVGKGSESHAASLAASSRRPGLKQLAMRGAAWTIAGYGVGQAMRLGSNLILTRLLFPEVFGLMAVVNVVIQGLNMFSDVGLRGSIVHHAKGDDERFVHTAWTLQVIRGGLLWLGVLALAWPAAQFYEIPELLWLLPIVGLTTIINGFDSVAKLSAVRHILQHRLVIIDLSVQLVSLSFMLCWAVYHRSVWALVAGTIVGSILKAILTHVALPGHKMRFALDRDALHSQLQFGIWIFLSTAMTFVISQGDRAVLGKLLTAEQLGVYSIAFFLAQAVPQVVQTLSANILFPVYAQLRHKATVDFRGRTLRVRTMVLAAAIPALWLLGILGDQLVRLLYDNRYANAGWMLEILALGAVGTCVISSAERVMLASGDSFRHMIFQVAQAGLVIIGMAVGAWYADIQGFLIGLAMARWIGYIPMAFLIRRYGVWLPGLDGTVFGLSLGVIALHHFLS